MRRFASLSLCATVAIRDSISKAGLRIGLRDHRQRLQHGEIGQRRIGATRSASSSAFGSAPPAS
jgi:hypothetical protein